MVETDQGMHTLRSTFQRVLYPPFNFSKGIIPQEKSIGHTHCFQNFEGMIPK